MRHATFVYIVLAAIPVVFWLCMELDARKHSALQKKRRRP